MKLTAHGLSDVGLKRSNNEDGYLVAEPLGLFIVADGMGGHAAGEVASSLAIETVRELLEPRLTSAGSAEELAPLLAEAMEGANRAVRTATEENPAWQGMGTTLTVLLLRAGQALLAHVGDSRLYRWRGQRLEQLSDDHSLVGDQLRRGLISPEEAQTSNLRNLLLQAVGSTPELEVCQRQLAVEGGDVYLLCSDGLTDLLDDRQLAAILEREPEPAAGCRELIARALAAGGKDNVTAVLIKVESD